MTTSLKNGSLYTAINNRVATIEFGHPASNSFTSVLLKRLTDELFKVSAHKDVAVIILKSEGQRAFCAGASFDELLAISDLETGKAFFSGFAHVINAMRSCKQPIIGRIQGKTVGGGVGLASACDYVYATVEASIKLSEISIGIAPLVIAPALERKVGTSALAEMALHPTEWKNAYWAKEKGLYSKVYDSIAEMDKELEHHATKLASFNAEALAVMKSALWEGTEHWSDLLINRAAQSGKLALSQDTKEALAAFKK